MNLRPTLKKILDDFTDDFTRTAEDSRKEYLQTLGPGAVVPGNGRIYDAQRRGEFMERTSRRAADAHAAISRRVDEVKRLMTDPPSTDAVNTITMLANRDNLTLQDLEFAAERYGKNYQAYKTLASIGAKKQVRGLGNHPLDDELSALGAMDKSMARTLSLTEAESRGDSLRSVMSWTKLCVDALPND